MRFKKTVSPERRRAHPLSSTERQIARRIAALRKEIGLTLRELGEKAELSGTYLSRVENGQTAVTLATLSRLANVFGVSAASFFEEDEAPQPILITRAGQGRRMRFRGRDGPLALLLAAGKPRKLMEPLIVDVPTKSSSVAPQAHPGEEFNLVLDGACEFLFGADTFNLEAGDSIYFDAMVPHLLRAIGKSPCRVLAVVSSRDFRVHRNIGQVIEERIQA